MNKKQLEQALRAAGEIARDRDFIIFGSQCILGVLESPPKACLVSAELDLYPRHHPQAMPLLVNRLGRRSWFSKKNGFFVDCVTPDLAAMPEGWTDRLVPFRTKGTGGVTGWCLELHDLAASKLAASREKDLRYIEILFKHRLIKRAVLQERVSTLPIIPSRREELIAFVKRGFKAGSAKKKVPSKRTAA